MAEHIDGPLGYERMGRSGPVMAFAHPDPMDTCPRSRLAGVIGIGYRVRPRPLAARNSGLSPTKGEIP